MNEKRSQQRFERELNARTSTIEQVNRVFNGAIQDMVTHAEILDGLTKHVYSSKNYQRLTIAWKEYVRGYVDCHFDIIYRRYVLWGFKPLGVFCATFEQVQKDYHDEIVKDACNGFHYWEASLESGNIRSYSSPKEIK